MVKRQLCAALALSAAVLLLLAACGGGDTAAGPAAMETTRETTEGNAGDSPPATLPDLGETAENTIQLAWDAPAGDAEGVAGYRLHYGTTSALYTDNIDVGAQTTCTVAGLSPGTYYLAVTAYDAAGNKTGFSNEVVKTVP